MLPYYTAAFIYSLTKIMYATTLDGYSSRHDKSRERDGEKNIRILGPPWKERLKDVRKPA